MSDRIQRRHRMHPAPGTRDRHLPAIAAATAHVRPAARGDTQPALASFTPYSGRDSAEGTAPLRLGERQDPERDQPQCYQDEWRRGPPSSVVRSPVSPVSPVCGAGRRARLPVGVASLARRAWTARRARPR
jgi:hypothetical protein